MVAALVVVALAALVGCCFVGREPLRSLSRWTSFFTKAMEGTSLSFISSVELKLRMQKGLSRSSQ